MNVVEPSALLATDLTDRFPTISSRGYNYIIVCYIYDTNGIIVRPMKNRSVDEVSWSIGLILENWEDLNGIMNNRAASELIVVPLLVVQGR